MTTKYLIWGYNPTEPGTNRLWATCKSRTEMTRTLSTIRYESSYNERIVVENRGGQVVREIQTIKPIGAGK